MKTDRQAKTEPGSVKSKVTKKPRSSRAKTSSRGNGTPPFPTYEHAPIGIVECSPDGKHISANEEFCRFLGYGKEELIGKSLKELSHEDDYPVDAKLHQQLVEGKIPFYRLEKRYLHKNGRSIWAELTRSIIRDRAGNPLYTIGVVLDISDRKQVERVLRESTERLRLATEAARMFTWELDLKTRIYTFADNFERVLGFSAGLLPKNSVEVVESLSPKEDMQVFWDAVTKAIEGHRDLQSQQLRMIDPDSGEIVWLEVNAKIVYDEDGSAQRMFGVAQNITDNKRAQQEILVISRMPEENPHPVMRLTPKGEVLYANPPSASLLRSWARSGAHAIPDELQAGVAEVFASGAKQEVEIEQDGKVFSATLAPIPEAGYVNFYGSDVTQRRQAEQSLRESEERFRALVSQATAGIIQTDLHGRLTLANQKITEMLDYHRLELIGKTMQELTHASDWAEFQERFEQLTQTGKPFEIEQCLVRRDQSTIWASQSMSPLRDASGNMHSTIAVIVDITERKQFEQALKEFARQQEALYRFTDQLQHTNSLEGIFDAALNAILNALQCDRASILLFDDQDVMSFVAWRGLSDAYRKATNGHSPWKPDAINPEPICMDDIRTADLSDSLRTVIQSEGIGALAFIPLVSNGKLIGKFMTYYNAPHIFTEDETELSLTIARQLASGVDRKRAEEALRTSEENYRRIVETANEGIWEIDRETRTTFVNSHMAEMLGYRVDEMMGRSSFEFVFPEDKASSEHSLARAKRGGSGQSNEFRFRRKDGSALWTLVSSSPQLDAAGNFLGSIAMIADITERKRAEAALQASEQRFREIFETAGVSVWLEDFTQVKRAMEGLRSQGVEDFPAYFLTHPEFIRDAIAQVRILDVNNETLDLFGAKTKQQLLGSLSNVFAPETEQIFVEELLALAEGRQTVRAETQVRRLDGRPIAVLFTVHFAPQTGDQSHVIVTLTDITERKRMEEALRFENERFMRFIDSNIVGILIGGSSGKIMLANDYYLRLLGVSRQDFMEGKVDWRKFTPPEWLPADEKAIQELHERGVCEPYEKEYVRADGTRVPVYITNAMLPGPGEEIAAFVLDITERKRAEEALRRNEQMLATMIEAAPFGVYFIDSQFRLQAINKGSEAVFSGIDPLLGRDFAKILRLIWKEPFATEAIERFRHTLRTGESFISPTIIEERANIEEIQAYDWQIHRIILPDGTYGVVCYFYDLSEQKRMEAAVRASESLYRTIARSIPGGGVYVVDKDMRYIVADGTVTEAFGLSREVLEGRTVSEAFPDERGIRMVERLQRTFAGETVSFETEHKGRVYWTQQAPLSESVGQAIIVTLDITERKRAEEALRQSEERFVQFMEHLPGLAWIKDMQGRYIYANVAAEDVFDTPREKLYGKTDEDIFPPEVASQFKTNDQQALREGKGIQVVETLQQNDGILHYSLVSKFPIPGPDGRTALVGGTAFDITERKRAEVALQESEERFRAILKQATAGIVRKDTEGRFVYVNEAFCNMLGYTESELLGKTVWEFMYPDDVLENKQSFNRLVAEGVPFKLERRFIREDGSLIWVDASVSPVTDATGKPQSAVAVEVDITARKQAEEALQQVNLQLETRVQERTAELRAMNKSLQDEIRERRQVELALDESRRRLQILSQRLVEVQEEERRAIARELHDRVGQTLSALNINLIIMRGQISPDSLERVGPRFDDSMQLVGETITLVRDVMSNLRPAVLDDYGLEAALQSHVDEYMSRYGIQVVFDRPAQPIPRLGPSIEMTFLRIAQEALMNIARHANASQVRLSLWQDDDSVCMVIQDNGSGIASWQQANRPGSHGLTIMRERAEAFGGNFKVGSVPGKGTKIEMSIPLGKGSQNEAQKEMLE